VKHSKTEHVIEAARYAVFSHLVETDPVVRADVERAIAVVTGRRPSLDEERTLDEIYDDDAYEAAVDDAIMDAIDGG
jgi:hypothetical protein